ncbi:MAG: GntR family transcriptional regulator [Eubacteriales bacterium]|nr:GntR family transcriptional regulator [Eubacteriales bacterium]
MSIQDYLEGRENIIHPKTDSLYRSLCEEILAGRIAPGERLTEKQICDRFQMSRTPVREVLTRLEEAGLCRIIQNRGAFVLEITEQDILDLFEMQAELLVTSIRWAVERITEKEMEELTEVFDFLPFYTKTGDFQKLIQINDAFCRIQFRAAHNRFAEKQLTAWSLYIRYAFPDEYKSPEAQMALLQEQGDIFTAFLHRDPEEGVAAMREHIEGSRRRKFGDKG